MEFNKPALTFTRRIGNTVFKVNCYFAPDGKATFEDKVLRLVRHEAMDKRGGCGIMNVPQMSRQSERSA